ncbi:MAG TPA: ice-binding family protein [Syntrophomonadaceae bacterium]|nr:ice-binding family protein [Syntrophomonadaceae bacterium]
MKKLNKMSLVPLLLTLLMLVVIVVPTMSMAAQPTVDLRTTSSFAVLAGSAIVNTGPTTINGSAGGDVGVYPGTAVTGFPPGTVSAGTIHAADAAAGLAENDLVTAYNDAAGRSVDVDLSGQDLGGLTLTPGVYSFSSSAQLTGTLTLDGQNDLDPVFVFKVGSTLTTASGSDVNLINGARYCRTFWQVGSSATLGTNSQFVGHIFALTSITATTGATVQGQLLARNGAVTLDNNTIINGFCETPPAAATLHVIKHVINDSGRTAVAANFNLHVKTSGSDVTASPAAGVESPGTTYTLAAGTYVVSEDAFAGYSVSYSGDSDSSGNITLASGDNKTVTITNDDIPLASLPLDPAILHVIKHVINDNGRTAVAADFSLHVKTSGSDVTASPAPGVESPGNSYTLAAGTYVVSEDDFAAYTVSYSGDSDSSGNITLASGDNKTVTITNNDTTISNSSGGGGYSQINSLLINVINTPEPLALTSGPGSVTYTYKVTNPGVVALSKVSVTDDKVSPVTYVSGDVNADNLLQPNETWIYSSKMNLNATTTNTATATGSANGMTATDIAFTTVIVTQPGVVKPAVTNGVFVITPPVRSGVVVAPAVTSGEVVTKTVTGGQIPNTSTPFSVPMYVLLLIGVALTLVGALGWRNRKRYE